MASAWLLLAAGLEALGPLIGKFLIDNYLLPRNAQLPEIAGLLAGRAGGRHGGELAALPAAGAAGRRGDALGAARARERVRGTCCACP